MAVIGTGGWAGRLVSSVQDKSKSVGFIAAVSRNPDVQSEFGEKFGLTVCQRDEVFSNPNVDAILVASAHSDHLEVATRAAEAGKHVFVEKPLATNIADAQKIVRACDTAGVVLGHGFNRRFAPAYLDMLSRLHRSEIGELLHLEGQFSGPSGYVLKPGMWRADRSECPLGAMTARGIHALDSMISMAGPVKSVFCQSENRALSVDLDDVTSALLRFDSGATGYLASHHATAEIWRVQIYGTKGWIEMTGDTELKVKTLERGEVETVTFTGVDKERAELEAFADTIGGGKTYPVTQQQALNGIATIDAMLVSSQSGQPQSIRH